MKLKAYLTAALLLLIFSSTAFAQTTFRKEITDKLSFSLDPGATVTHTVQVVNTGVTPVDVEIYATDASTTNTGRFAILTKYRNKEFMGKWITFKESKMSLKGGETRDMEFTITIPADTTPGSFAGGLSIEPAIPSIALQQTGAVISTRVAMPIYVNVNGKKNTSFTWTAFSRQKDEPNKFLFSFENKGNTFIKVNGDIIIKNFYGEPEVMTLSEMTLLQNSPADTALVWNTKPFFGSFTATAKLTFTELDMEKNTYKKIGVQSKTLTFTIIPWGSIIAFVLLIVLLIALAILKKILHKKYLAKCVNYQVTAGETLVIIANKNKVNWQKLAKLNRLKPPFDLSQGQKILLPPKK